MVHGILQQSSCRSYHISQFQYCTLTFGMCQDQRFRMLRFQFHNLFNRELFMHVTGSVPKQHIPVRNRVDIITQIPIRTKDYFLIFGEAFHDLLRIGGSHHHICHCFHGSCCVDVRNNGVSRVFFDKLCKLIRRTTVRQRTTCRHVGYQHFLVRTKHLCRFPHKVNATHHNNVRFRFGCPLSQCQTVANVIGDVLYFPFLVVVSQNDCILFFL